MESDICVRKNQSRVKQRVLTVNLKDKCYNAIGFNGNRGDPIFANALIIHTCGALKNYT